MNTFADAVFFRPNNLENYSFMMCYMKSIINFVLKMNNNKYIIAF